MRSQKTKQTVEIALMSALLCVIAPFTIPVPGSPVPLSLATLGVYLAALLLGAKRGALSVLVYLLLGMVGLPVFSGFSGGIGILLGPTGGYLMGYVPCALLVGWLTSEKVPKRNSIRNCMAMLLGTICCYFLGTLWFLAVMEGTYSAGQVFLLCVAPYLVFDVIKILLAAAIAVPVQKRIRRNK